MVSMATRMGHPGETDPATDGDASGSLRVVVTGKGGVGKTTLVAALARVFARGGRRVLAVDADAQLNLAAALGMPREVADSVAPLGQDAAYVEERTGARQGDGYSPLIRLNPDVDDVVDRFGLRAPDGVRFLAMGTLSAAGGGCLCPENALLAATVRAIALRGGEAILMDTQAGIEHFGRAIARGFGHAVVVSDPTYNGIGVAVAAARLARDLGIPAVHLVVNRIRDGDDHTRAEHELAVRDGVAFDTRTWLREDHRVAVAEPSVGPLLEGATGPFLTGVRHLAAQLAWSRGAAGALAVGVTREPVAP
jgi:CO dehydrogenase maturation factor